MLVGNLNQTTDNIKKLNPCRYREILALLLICAAWGIDPVGWYICCTLEYVCIIAAGWVRQEDQTDEARTLAQEVQDVNLNESDQQGAAGIPHSRLS